MLADLQVHSVCGSPDSAITPSELVGSALSAGLGAVGITEHLPYDPSELRMAGRDAGLIVMPGREVSYCGAHLLVFAEDDSALDELPRVVTGSTRLNESGLLVIWAHPAAPSGSSAYAPLTSFSDEVGGVVHAVEVLNGRHLQFAEVINSAEELAARFGVGTTGGSDAHEANEIGKVATFVDAAVKTEADLIQAIRTGKSRAAINAAWWRGHRYFYRPALERYAL